MIQVVLVTHSLGEVLAGASQKLGLRATHLYTPQGGLIDDIRLIRWVTILTLALLLGLKAITLVDCKLTIN